MATHGDGQEGSSDEGLIEALALPFSPPESSGVIELPAYVQRTLRSSVGARPERRALELLPRPDDRILKRLREAGVVRRDLRLRRADDSPRAARSTERLIDALALHSHHDLSLQPGRCEAMAQALGYLFWFQRRFAEQGPLGLDPATVESCFGNYYIRRGGPDRPALSWIHYGVRGAATFAAFCVRAGWWDPERAEGLIALSEKGPWFRERLRSYWTAEGDDWHDWLAEADPQAL